jgi:hypothetical protein
MNDSYSSEPEMAYRQQQVRADFGRHEGALMHWLRSHRMGLRSRSHRQGAHGRSG